ncbi:MAG: hypothetical protein LUH17_09505 [Acidaminococcaceae bacterium]|nr:hypothetical protein [Acidaminococcaceae bacterium]
MKVLNCTMGLASDTIVASFITGAEGVVCAVEASPLLHFVVSEGLQNYQAEDSDLNRCHTQDNNCMCRSGNLFSCFTG